MENSKLNVTLHYPNDPIYEYDISLKKVNLDKVKEKIVRSGRGFIIDNQQNTLKKELKNIDGIYSSRFGISLEDTNKFMDKYKCECGFLKHRINNGIECPNCHTKVRFVDDDYGYFGWITIKDPYYIMHPNLYKVVSFLMGKDRSSGKERLDTILKPIDEKDINGYTSSIGKSEKDNPYVGIGMMEFVKRFDEIIEYFYKKNPGKKDYYEDIIKNRDKIFIQSIPVYTTQLRGSSLDGIQFNYELVNSIYTMMVKLSAQINDDSLKIMRKRKPKNQLLYDLNCKYNKLYNELEKIVSGKKGTFRSVFGGRYTFSARSVIVSNSSLKIDEVIMSYFSLVQLLEQSIINILQKVYNISYADAYNIWDRSRAIKDERVYNIIQCIINDNERGIPVLINRNPTISLGGILQMFVVGICDSYTLQLPLQILELLAADFDGDVLNILYMINKAFIEISYATFNPKNSFYISRNNGKLNTSVLFKKDTLINVNALINLARGNYSLEQLKKIERAQNCI